MCVLMEFSFLPCDPELSLGSCALKLPSRVLQQNTFHCIQAPQFPSQSISQVSQLGNRCWCVLTRGSWGVWGKGWDSREVQNVAELSRARHQQSCDVKSTILYSNQSFKKIKSSWGFASCSPHSLIITSTFSALVCSFFSWGKIVVEYNGKRYFSGKWENLNCAWVLWI